MISQRYATVVAGLLALALIPAIIHNYLDAKSEDTYRAKAISFDLAGLQFVKTERRDVWAKEIFDAEDWIERSSVVPGGSEIRLFVGRSYDYKRLYHHPELAILYGKDLEKAGVKIIKTMDNVPVHFLRNRKGMGIAAYCLLYDDEFVENPIGFQLSSSLELLIGARKPMTLFFIYDNRLSSIEAFEESLASRVLKTAVDNFLSRNSNREGRRKRSR